MLSAARLTALLPIRLIPVLFALFARRWPAIPVWPILHLPCRDWAQEQFPILARMSRNNVIFLAWRMVLQSQHSRYRNPMLDRMSPLFSVRQEKTADPT